MDTQILTGLVDQAVGGAIAIVLITRIDKRLEQMTADIQTLNNLLKEALAHGDISTRG